MKFDWIKFVVVFLLFSFSVRGQTKEQLNRANFQIDYGSEQNKFYLVNPTNSVKIKCLLTRSELGYTLQGVKDEKIIWTNKIDSKISKWYPSFLKLGWVIQTNRIIQSYGEILALEQVHFENCLDAKKRLKEMNDNFGFGGNFESSGNIPSGKVHVNPYSRKDGTSVKEHYRNSPKK